MRRINSLPVALLLIGLFLGGGSPCPAAADLPSDLDLVPRDAAGFVHLRAADLWQSHWVNDFRYIADQAGPEAWKAFEKKCPLNLATVDRVTFILVTPRALKEPFSTSDPESMSALAVVRVNRPFDRLQLIQALGPREKVYRHNLYYFNEEMWSGLAVIDERTFILGSEDALVRYFELSRQNDRNGPLQAALVEAAGKHQVTVGFNPTLLGKEKGSESMPPPMRQLLKAHCGLLTVDLNEGLRVDARFEYLKEEQAEEGEKALRDTLEMARGGLAQPIAELERMLRDPGKAAASDLPENFSLLMGLGFLRELDGLLKQTPLQRRGLTVKGSLTYQRMQSTQVLFVAAAVITLGQNASGTFSFVSKSVSGPGGVRDPIEEHLRNLSQAMDRYHEKHGSYPPAAIYDKDGRPLLSWRVALLPYLGEEGLYSEFKLDEPWDSLHNKRLLKKLPKALQSPNMNNGWGRTRWKTITHILAGEDTVFEGKKGVRKSDVTRKAILLAHLTDDAAVYWTKPADLDYAADKPLPNLFGKYGNRFQVVLTDGTYRAIDKSLEERTLRALIERHADRPERKKEASAKPGDLEAVWKDFIQIDDAGTRKAWQEIAVMIHAPDQAVPFLKERVKAVPRPDPKRIAQCLANLDNRNFKTRDKAMSDLEDLGELAAGAIEKKLASKDLSTEARRRLDELVQKPKTVLSVSELRTVRAIEVLAGIGSPEARAVLDDLAAGADGTVVTEEARKAAASVGRRAGGR